MKLTYIDELTALKRNYLHLRGEVIKLREIHPNHIIEIGSSNVVKVTDRELAAQIRELVLQNYCKKMQEMEAKLQLIGVDDFSE